MARILVVDDEGAVRRVCSKTLERAGHDVVETDNAEQADRWLREQAGFDLLLTDVVMPGLNGLELGQRVQAHHPELPVLLMSAFSSEIVARDQPLEFPLLEKPFTPRDLLAAIDQLLIRSIDSTLSKTWPPLRR